MRKICLWIFLIEHLEANKGELRLILRVLKLKIICFKTMFYYCLSAVGAGCNQNKPRPPRKPFSEKCQLQSADMTHQSSNGQLHV